MHIYTLLRGKIDAIKEWEAWMTSQYLKFSWKDKKGKEVENAYAQLQVREVKLYEIVCPEEHGDMVMSWIKPSNDKFWGKAVGWLGKFLGLKKAPKNWEPCLFPCVEGIATAVLGTKKDKVNFKRKQNLEEEGGIPSEQL